MKQTAREGIYEFCVTIGGVTTPKNERRINQLQLRIRLAVYAVLLFLHICYSLSAVSIEPCGGWWWWWCVCVCVYIFVAALIFRTFFQKKIKRKDSIADFVGIDDVIIFFICCRIYRIIIVSSSFFLLSIPFEMLVCVCLSLCVYVGVLQR